MVCRTSGSTPDSVIPSADGLRAWAEDSSHKLQTNHFKLRPQGGAVQRSAGLLVLSLPPGAWAMLYIWYRIELTAPKPIINHQANRVKEEWNASLHLEFPCFWLFMLQACRYLEISTSPLLPLLPTFLISRA